MAVPQDWWIEAAVFDRSGVSRKEIAKRLHKDQAVITRLLGKRTGSSSNDLGQMQAVALIVRDAYVKLKSKGYYSQLLDVIYGPPSKRVTDYKARLARSGQWFGGSPPSGYKSGPDHILVPDANAPRIKRIYERIADGEPYWRVVRQERLRPRKAILKSRVYLGYIRFKGEEIQGSQQPLISEELWKRAQPWLAERPHGVNKVPFALKFLGSKYVLGDLEQVRKIREAFKMRVKGAKIADVAKHLGLAKTVTGKRLKDRRYVDAGVIDLATWQRTQKVPKVRPVAERLKLQGHETEAKIVEALRKGPTTSRQISVKIGRTQAAITGHLRSLQRAGRVTREPGSWSYTLST